MPKENKFKDMTPEQLELEIIRYRDRTKLGYIKSSLMNTKLSDTNSDKRPPLTVFHSLWQGTYWAMLSEGRKDFDSIAQAREYANGLGKRIVVRLAFDKRLPKQGTLKNS